MNVRELQNYGNWVGQTPQKLYLAVLSVGGWKAVFPDCVPRWASKVRNYFNIAPKTLERLTGDSASRALKQSQRFKFLLECHEVQTFNKNHRNYRPNPNGQLDPPPFKVPAGCPAKAEHDVVHTGITDSVAINNALSGQVYKDEVNRLWYQMSAGSTIYHYGSDPVLPKVEAVYVEKIKGQNDTPVFKLVSPDNTGGSLELILKNSGRNDVVGANQKVDVGKIIVTDPAQQGSYNYSETTQVGLTAHELRDVRTHVHGRFFYVNPINPFSALASRKFPEKDLQGQPLAHQN